MKKVYIAGCGGMLGKAFYKIFTKKYDVIASDIDVNEEWLHKLDFRDFDAYRDALMFHYPDILIHLGAHTDLEYCEQNPDDAYNTNTLAVENAVILANQLDIPIVYISTAGIFDGKKDLYNDWDIPNPLGTYARSKYAGERYVVENANSYFVFRAGWMMGGGKKDKKFVKKIYDQLKKRPKKIYVVNDKDGTPTYTYDFAKNAMSVIDSELYGLYNMVCGGVTSRLEIANEIIKHYGLQETVELVPVTSEYFKKDYWAVRPPSERLDNTKLRIRGMNTMRHWKEALHEYLFFKELEE